MDLIAHPSATIVPYVYYLVIDQVKFRYTKLFDAMLLRLPRFVFACRLDLRNIRWCNYQVLSVDKLVSTFKSVTDLRLHKPNFNESIDSWSLIACFPSLERLSITNAAFSNPLLFPALDVAGILPDLRPPKIHDLELSETLGNQTHILEWFSSRGTLVDSHSVDLECLALPSLNEYLQVLGPALLFLQIDVRFRPTGACLSLFQLIQFIDSPS
jgi:hypothetical protein